MSPALRVTSSRALRSSRPYDTQALIPSPARNTTARTRLNLSRNPIRNLLPAPRELVVGLREADQAERRRVHARRRPRRPEAELHARLQADLELLDHAIVVGL